MKTTISSGAQSVFDARIEPVTESGCWLWMGGRMNAYDHGCLTYLRERFLAHRASWMIHFGDIPEGLHVLHRCDVPRCVNPAHLYLGSHLDNMRDASLKGRKGPIPRETVLAIRTSGDSGRTLAARYGLTRDKIKDIRRRKTYKHY